MSAVTSSVARLVAAVRSLTFVASLALIAACGGSPASASAPTLTSPPATATPAATSAPTHRIQGTLTLSDDSVDIGDNATCHGTGGYDDITAGLGVVVRDGAGVVLATSALGSGSYPDVSDLSTCRFVFSVTNVPEASFYSIEVGHRGDLTYSFTELEERDWTVAFELGG